MIQENESILIDTSVWIASFRGRPADITEMTRQLLNNDRALTCGPVLFEIHRGLRTSEHRRIIPLMNAVVCLPFEEQDWELTGKLDASLRSNGITIPQMDLLIARVCLRHDVPLFTLDQHFEAIEGIRLFII